MMNGHALSFIFDNINVSLVVSDPSLPDHPMVYVNQRFVKLTGYSREDCVGQNCRFLQGPDTDPDTVQKIRDAIAAKESIRVELLNYRKDGTPFWNELNIYPVLGANGDALNYVAMQFPADAKRQHKKQILAEMVKIMDL